MPVDSTTVPDPVADCPASAKLVFVVVREQGPLSFSEIAAECRLSSSTTHDALKALRRAGVVEQRPAPPDGRRTRYAVK